MRHLLPRDQGDTCCILSIDQDVIIYDLKSFHCKVEATTFTRIIRYIYSIWHSYLSHKSLIS